MTNGIVKAVAGNGGSAATGALSTSPAFTVGTATTHTSNTFTTATHSSSGSYSGSTAVN